MFFGMWPLRTELGVFWVSEAPVKGAFAGCLAAMPAVPDAQQHLVLWSFWSNCKHVVICSQPLALSRMTRWGF